MIIVFSSLPRREDMGRPQPKRSLKCKILLPKFNTWKPLHLERKNGFEVPLLGNVGAFFAKNHCRYGAIASPLHRNRDAISL